MTFYYENDSADKSHTPQPVRAAAASILLILAAMALLIVYPHVAIPTKPAALSLPLLLGGVLLFGAAWALDRHWISPARKEQAALAEGRFGLPTVTDVIVAAIAAVIVTVANVGLAELTGLSFHLPYDGAGYVTGGKNLSFKLAEFFTVRSPAVEDVFGELAGLWRLALATSYLVLGVGDWQSQAANIFSAFSVLFCATWIGRRVAGRAGGFAALLATAALPILSPSLWIFTDRLIFGDVLNDHIRMTILRPDLLAAAIMVWAVTPALVGAKRLAILPFVVAGLALSLSLLAKGNTGPLTLIVFTVAILYVLFRQRRQFAVALATVAWAALPLAFAVHLWVMKGGLDTTIQYIVFSLGNIIHYTDSPGGLLFYLQALPTYWSAPLIVLAGALLITVGVSSKAREQLDRNLLAGLVVASIAAILVPTFAFSVGNIPLGYPFALLLWLAVIVIWGAAANTWITTRRDARSAIAATGTGMVVLVALAVTGGLAESREKFAAVKTDNDTLKQLAADLARHYEPGSQFFTPITTSGIPHALTFRLPAEQDGKDLLGLEGIWYVLSEGDGRKIADDPAFRAGWLNHVEKVNSVFVIPREDPADPNVELRALPFFYPHLRTVQAHIRAHPERFEHISDYAFSGPARYYSPLSGTLSLYVKRDVPLAAPATTPAPLPAITRVSGPEQASQPPAVAATEATMVGQWAIQNPDRGELLPDAADRMLTGGQLFFKPDGAIDIFLTQRDRVGTVENLAFQGRYRINPDGSVTVSRPDGVNEVYILTDGTTLIRSDTTSRGFVPKQVVTLLKQP